MIPPDLPNDVLLLQLYSCFSEHTYCAGWMLEPQEPRMKREFTNWLRRYVVHPVSERPLQDYEKEALGTLRECWADAHAEYPSS